MPDTGSQTVALLTQLVNISSGAPIVVQDTPSFQPPASIVRVNVLWFLSLILSLGCALLTTSMQQSARVYLDYAQHRATPRKQARVREYMFRGVEKFRLSQAVGTMPFLLHASVFLFFAGLIEFLHPINLVVGSYALGCIILCVFIYATLTLLAILHPNCPYRTPLSGFTYFIFQYSAFCLFFAATRIEGACHGLLLELWRWSHPRLPGSRDHGPAKWREVLEDKFHMYYERFVQGLQWKVMASAMEAPSSVDQGALHWILTTLDDKQKIEEFAAHMPGFFNSTDTPDASSTMFSLMFEHSNFDTILASRLHELLQTCLPGASHLNDDQRISRLSVCLTSLWYCLRASNLPENLNKPLAPYVRAVFASSDVIRWIQREQDSAVRLLGCCFGSLVVKKLASDLALPVRPPTTTTELVESTSDIALPACTPTTAELAVIKSASDTPSPYRTPTTAELAYLKTVLDASGPQVWALLRHKGAIDLANVTLLASAGLDTLVDSRTNGVPADVVDVFQQTLRIIGEEMSSIEGEAKWNADQVAEFREIYFRFANAPIPSVLKERLENIRKLLPSPNIVLPTPELHLPTTPAPGTSQKREDPVPTEGAPDCGYAEASAEGILFPIPMPARPESG